VLLARIARALGPLVPEGTEVLAGLELGGIPLATTLAQVTGKPAHFLRKKAIRHRAPGRRRRGAGQRMLLVEDVITTGGQMNLAQVGACWIHRRARAVLDARPAEGVAFYAQSGH